jgi:hypothetical protein
MTIGGKSPLFDPKAAVTGRCLQEAANIQGISNSNISPWNQIVRNCLARAATRMAAKRVEASVGRLCKALPLAYTNVYAKMSI